MNRLVGVSVNAYEMIAEKLGARLQLNIAPDTLTMIKEVTLDIYPI